MPADNGYQVGDTAREFKLKNVDGKLLSMADYKDAKGFIVTFTCNTCPYAIAYEDRLIDLHKKYAPKGYPVIAINPNDVNASPGDSYKKMQQRAKEKNFLLLTCTTKHRKLRKLTEQPARPICISCRSRRMAA